MQSGQLEWNSANYLLEHGIATYRPACFGHRTVAGIERQSFFITEQLAGQCLMDVVRDTWRKLGSDEQNRLLGELAIWIQGIHRLNISLPDLYVYHLFVDKDGDGRYGFSVIDIAPDECWNSPATDGRLPCGKSGPTDFQYARGVFHCGAQTDAAANQSERFT
jgi:hypothetical protein